MSSPFISEFILYENATETQHWKIGLVDGTFDSLWQKLEKHLPEGENKGLALRNLTDAMRHCKQAILFDEKKTATASAKAQIRDDAGNS